MINTDLKVEDLVLSPEMKNLPMLAKYDEAVKQLLEQVFAGSVVLAPYDRAFELHVTQMKKELRFPFISIFPSQGYTLSQTNNFVQSNIGHMINRKAITYDDDTLVRKGTSGVMQNYYQCLNFDITYQIDCWGTNRVEALQLIQELLFWFKAQGQVLVSYANQNITCNLTIGNTINDNSTYLEYEDIGNLYRFTFNIVIEAPVFRTQNYLNIKDIELNLEMKEEN